MLRPAAGDSVRTFWTRVVRGPWATTRVGLWEELASLLGAGIGVREGLASLQSRHSGAAGDMLDVLSESVERGSPLAEAMAKRPELFSRLEVALIATGESSGRLDQSLRTLAGEIERQKKLRNRLITAIAYPVLMLHALLVIPTIGLVWAPHGFGAWVALVVPGILGFWGALALGLSLHAMFADSPGYGRFLLRIPSLGAALRDTAVARFSRALATLHGAGLPLDRCVAEAAEVSGNGWTRAQLATAVGPLRGGMTPCEAIHPTGVLPHEVFSLLATGEQSGDLEHSMLRAADLMEERAQQRLTRGIAVLPIALILIVGLGVALMALYVIGGYFSQLRAVM